MSIEEDLKKYADSKGTGMAMNWPVFIVSNRLRSVTIVDHLLTG